MRKISKVIADHFRCRRRSKKEHQEIMTKLSELKGVFSDILTRLDEGFSEVTAEIAKLKEQLGNVELDAETQATLDSVVSKAQAIADIIQQSAPPPA